MGAAAIIPYAPDLIIVKDVYICYSTCRLWDELMHDPVTYMVLSRNTY